jgi:hypothetical protein
MQSFGILKLVQKEKLLVVFQTSGGSPFQISKFGCLKILKNQKRPGPTCQSLAPLKRRPVAGLACAIAARPRVSGPSATTVVGHVRRPARPHPPRSWASEQRPNSSPPRSHLHSTALTTFSLLCLSPFTSTPSTTPPRVATSGPPPVSQPTPRGPPDNRPPLRLVHRTPPPPLRPIAIEPLRRPLVAATSHLW